MKELKGAKRWRDAPPSFCLDAGGIGMDRSALPVTEARLSRRFVVTWAPQAECLHGMATSGPVALLPE